MKKLLIIGLILCSSEFILAQSIQTEKVWRVNILNPAVELELPTGQYSTLSSAIGIGYGGGYPKLTSHGNGFIYIVSPFLDIQQKWFYNLNKRSNKNKSIVNNSGNFVSTRLLTRGASIKENVYRTSKLDFALSTTWGIQRKIGKNFHLLFDMGPEYYFDTKGNDGFWGFMLQLNLGIDL